MIRKTGITAFAILALAGVSAASAAVLPASVKALIPAAQNEGGATIFGTILNPRQIKAFNKSFNACSGTKIKLNQIGGRHTRKSAEVVQAMTPNTDVYRYVQGKKVYNVGFEWRFKNDARLIKKYRAILKGK